MKNGGIFIRTGVIAMSFLCCGYASAQENEVMLLDKILALKRVEYERQGLSQEKIEKNIAKFEKYWSPRLAEDGTLGSMTAAFPERAAEAKAAGVFCETDVANWELFGPHVYDGSAIFDGQAGFNHQQWNGLMTEVYVAEDESFLVGASELGGLWRRADSEPGWTNVTDDLNLPYITFNSIVGSPYNQDVIFASSGSGDYGSGSQGILKSIDGGLTWSVLTTFTDAYCDAFPAQCLAGNENFITVDYLMVDKINSTGSTGVHLYAITATNPDGSDIWKSTDSGVNWIRLRDPSLTFPAPSLPTNNRWIDIKLDDAGNLFGTTNFKYGADARYWKYNAASGWTDLTTSITVGSTLALKFSTPEGSTIYAIRDDTERSILVSSDRGDTWSVLTTIPPVGLSYGGVQAKSEIEYHPQKNLIYIGGNRLWSIDPEVLTPTPLSIPQGHIDVRDLYFAGGSGDYSLYTANDGGISKVNLQDNTYEDLSGNSLPVLSFSEIGTANSSSAQYLGGVGHNHAKVFNNGTWTQFSSGDGDAGVIHPTNPDLGYVVSSNARVFRYDFAGGGSYSSMSPTQSQVGGGWFNAHIEIHPGANNLVYYTNNKGSDGVNRIGIWDQISPVSGNWTYQELIPEIIWPGEIGIATSNPARVYVAEFSVDHDDTHINCLIRSDNWGNTGSWTSVGAGTIYDATGIIPLGTLNAALGYKRITDIEVDPYNHDHLWISISGYMAEDEKQRVLESFNGGDSWREFSQGLSRYPVHAIVYIPSTNGLMFAGTESGVFYRDKSMSAWECYNNGMPYCVISDLDYNTCSGELVAATYGRGIWESAIPASDVPLTYTSNTTLPAGVFDFNTDIVVKAPAIFTVLGTVRMANDRRITVEPGATLIVDGGTITNQCDYLWEGIFLGGTIDQPQLPDSYITDPYQGTLFLKNNGKIEHAQTGVTTQAYDSGFTHGARIFSDEGVFVDNRNDVVMLSYPNNNVSYFKNTKFLTTGPLGDPDYIDGYGRELGGLTHVGMWEMNGVEFDKNIFANTGVFDQDIRGTGILSLDSECKVIGECNYLEMDGSCGDVELSFDRLTVGVDFRSSTNQHDLTVTRNEFEATVQGITVTGGRKIFVHDNFFLNYNGSDNFGGIDFMKSWGVYITSTTQVDVLDNYFSDGVSNAPENLNFYTRGIILQSTGNSDITIRKNTFYEGEMVAIHAWLNNEDAQTWCNDFYSEYGIYVDRPKVGISKFPTQGSSEYPTGNRFFYGCADDERHIYFDGIDPISPWQTILDYHSYVGAPFLPICISNDWNTSSYSNPSNVAPGYVRTFAQQTYNSKDCDLSHEAGDHEVGLRLEDVKRQAGLESELAELQNSEFDYDDLLAVLLEKNWLIKDEFGEIAPGNKYQELASLNRSGIRYEQNLIKNMDALVLAKDTTPIIEMLADASVWSKLAYVNSCITLNQPVEIDLSELPADYDVFYGVLLSLKKSNRTIYQMDDTEQKALRSIALKQTQAGEKAASLLAFVNKSDYTPHVDEFDHYQQIQKTNVNPVNSTQGVRVYPNPASDAVTVEIDADFKANSLVIYNLLGEIVFETQPKAVQLVDLTNWEKGIYIISIRSESGVENVKFILD